MLKYFRILNITTVISLGITCYIFYFVHNNISRSGKENEDFKINNYNCTHYMCQKIDDTMFSVHIIPHSHMDISWLKTFDEYYNGTSSSIDNANVKTLLESIVKALQLNVNRTFIISEIAYFHRWWNEIDDNKKTVVRSLVERKQLQFVSGGFVINDEALTHYSSIIDQMTLGLNFIKQTFGSCARPLIAWQLDTFGHSREMAYLLKEMNFNAIFLSRVPEHILHSMALDGYQFKWKTTSNNNTNLKDSTILTFVLPDGYCTPHEFCVDPRCGQNGKGLKTLAKNFISYVKERMLYYKSGHMVIPLGCDFHFQDALRTFGLFDRLLKIINENQKEFRVFYSTPNCYLKSILKKPSNIKVFESDLFPLYDSQAGYWIGFYSTRPILKRNIRVTNSLIRTTKKVTSLSDITINKKWREILQSFFDISKTMALMQHHDTITGTSRKCVIDLNFAELRKSQITTRHILVSAIDSIMKLKASTRKLVMLSDCPLLNISYCEATDNISPTNDIDLLIYNPLPYKYNMWLSLPVSILHKESYEITNIWNMLIEGNLLPIDRMLLKNKERPENSKARYNLIFRAPLIELGFTTFVIKRKRHEFWDMVDKVPIKNVEGQEYVILFNQYIHLLINMNTDVITLTKNGQVISFSIDIKCYCINTENTNIISGLYISVLREPPKTVRTRPFTYTLNGSVVKEIRRRYKKGISVVIRLYNDEDWIEIEWSIGGIIQTNKYNNEYILVYKSELLNNNVFYTDSNGRQLIKRTVYPQSPTESNYYPITSHVLFGEENGMGILIHSDRSHGVGGRVGGSIEIMVNRILLTSDGAGFAENLRDFGPDNKYLTVIGKNWIEFDKMKRLKVNHRIKSNEISNYPILFVKPDHIPDTYIKIHRGAYKQEKNLHILTLEPLDEHDHDRYLLRLENLKDFTNNAFLDEKNTMEVYLQNFFEGYTITEVIEMNLSADKEIAKENSKLKDFVVTLKPMEIITLVIKMVEVL